MDPQQSADLEARLAAIEYMVCNLYAVFHRFRGSTPSFILQAHESAREKLRSMTIPGLDPAQSDMAAANMQEHVERMLAAIEAMMGLGPRKI